MKIGLNETKGEDSHIEIIANSDISTHFSNMNTNKGNMQKITQQPGINFLRYMQKDKIRSYLFNYNYIKLNQIDFKF
jgi:hypothetical protein